MLKPLSKAKRGILSLSLLQLTEFPQISFRIEDKSGKILVICHWQHEKPWANIYNVGSMLLSINYFEGIGLLLPIIHERYMRGIWFDSDVLFSGSG